MVTRLDQKMSWEEICRYYASKISDKLGLDESRKFIAWMQTKKHVANGRVIGCPLTYLYAYSVQKKFSKEEDHFTVVVGPTGTGKSWTGAAIGALVSPDFSLEHILFNPETMIDSFLSAKRGQTIMIDEGALFLFSREALSKNNKIATKIFTICRAMGLHVIVCIPEFRLLDSYVRMDRVHSLVLMKNRGEPRFYSKRGIDIINEVYPDKKRLIKRVKVPASYWFDGRTRKLFPVSNDLSENGYKEHKLQNIRETLNNMRSELKITKKNYYNALTSGDVI